MEDKFFFKKYEEYDRTHWWLISRKKIIGDFINRYSNPDGCKLLDIGCAGSKILSWSRFGSVIGLDISMEAVSLAKKKIGGKVVQGSASALPFKSNSFELITALDVVEHLDEPESCLKDIYRICKVKGVVILTVPAYQFLYSRYADSGHKKRYVRREVEQLVAEQGFHILKLTYLNTLLFPLMAAQRLLFGDIVIKDKDAVDIVLAPPPKLLNELFKATFSFERFLLRSFNLPFRGVDPVHL